MSRLGKANTLAEILTSIVGDIAHETRTQVVEEGWTGKPSRDFNHAPQIAMPEAERGPTSTNPVDYDI